MLQPGSPAILGLGVFSIFAVLGGLVLLVGADHSAPGCTGPKVERCDYLDPAKAAVSTRRARKFQPDYGYEIVDLGSSVRVQQYLPDESLALFEGPAVVIDKASCRVCFFQVRESTEYDKNLRFSRFPGSTP